MLALVLLELARLAGIVDVRGRRQHLLGRLLQKVEAVAQACSRAPAAR